ncbi:hypothetical protein [Aeromonas caviae]|uniref:hypothetical protein n=1 Tax=Aeromonas caviae TaxID=648 RepID=UPI003F7937D0
MSPRISFVLTGGQRFFAGLQGKALLGVVFFWRRALAPCIARHQIIQSEERDDNTDSINIFFKHIYSEQLKKNLMT